ncbi:hypothetical protein Vadar_012899 [Vaccinium darrowii]|uniref:Uncharacterized protein n=1 Tax=Vaccinium darrowii TaxID=229202 RepID=A0ACB7YWX9_9ERIC|nr:hypothetical protein Vadar_012899 [Vaccinium darrowii]
MRLQTNIKVDWQKLTDIMIIEDRGLMQCYNYFFSSWNLSCGYSENLKLEDHPQNHGGCCQEWQSLDQRRPWKLRENCERKIRHLKCSSIVRWLWDIGIDIIFCRSTAACLGRRSEWLHPRLGSFWIGIGFERLLC